VYTRYATIMAARLAKLPEATLRRQQRLTLACSCYAEAVKQRRKFRLEFPGLSDANLEKKLPEDVQKILSDGRDAITELNAIGRKLATDAGVMDENGKVLKSYEE
jgi:hypothetical protein